jgi:DNA-binding beta-propeller fold protein YncE
MKRLRIFLAGIFAAAWMSGFAWAEGFRVGALLATGYDSVYMIDPDTGESQVLWQGNQTLGDIVYDPITQSAFITGIYPSADIYQLTWNAQNGFQMSNFLSGLSDTRALAVDDAGNIYFNQCDFVTHRIWKATPDGTVSPVSTAGYFGLFVPTRMALSPGDSRLYVSNVPDNGIDVVNLSDGAVSHLVDLSFPEAIDVANDGMAYASEGGPDGVPYRIVTITPSGQTTVYAQESWMEFMKSGFWGDLEFDDRNGTIYVAKDGLYAIDRNRMTHLISDNWDFNYMTGLDLVTVVPEPPTLISLLATTVIGLIVGVRRQSLLGIESPKTQGSVPRKVRHLDP